MPAPAIEPEVIAMLGGESACWRAHVCDACGALVESGPNLLALPADVQLARTTDRFDETTVPGGLRRAHRIAPGVWGRVVVDRGCLGFRFEDEEHARHLTAGDTLVIPPERPHHVEVVGPVAFCVEFHRGP